MTDILVPHRILGGSVLTTRAVTMDYSICRTLGIELLEIDPESGSGVSGRTLSRDGCSFRVVEIFEIAGYYRRHRHLQRLVSQRFGFRSPLAPQVLHVMGRDGHALAIVQERPVGYRLDALVAGLYAGRDFMPVELALAVASEVAQLRRFASSVVHLTSSWVVLSPSGHIRCRPVTDVEYDLIGTATYRALDDVLIPYWSTEVLKDTREAHSDAAEIYATGMLLYEVLAGRLPFAPDATVKDMVHDIVDNPRPPLRTQRADLPESVTSFVDRAVAHRPESRFESWAEFFVHLDACRVEFGPTSHETIAAWLQGLPDAMRTLDPPPVSAQIPTDERSLPHCGLEPMQWPPSTPPVHPDYAYPLHDYRPMLSHAVLRVDARPVSGAEYERFVLETSAAPGGPVNEHGHVTVSFEQASAYARWAGKRLPSSAEWLAAVGGLGAETLGVGSQWEWTTTRKGDGYFVRGRGGPMEHACRTDATPDVGFRCVCDDDYATAPSR